MTKYIYTFLVSAFIITLNVLWGSVISFFLSVTILAIIFYFVFQLQLEDFVNKILERNKADNDKFEEIGHRLHVMNNNRSTLLKFSAITLVFISAIVCVYLTTNPKGKSPWFLNNDYHGLSNTGIAFQDKLQLSSNSIDSNAMNGRISIQTAGSKAGLQFDQFLVPVMKLMEGRKSTLLNNIYEKPVAQSIQFTNASFDLTVKMEPYKPGFFKKIFTSDKNGLAFYLTLKSSNKELLSQWNVQAPFNDSIKIITTDLEVGKDFFELLLNARVFESGKPESYQVLEYLLQELGDSYLLASYAGETKQYKFFPGKKLFNNKYKVLIDGEPQKPQLKCESTIDFTEKFYVGFNNHKRLIYVDKLDNTQFTQSTPFANALYFDYPNTYMLKSAGKQEAGNKNIRFLTNDLNSIIQSDLKEGFLFNNYQLNTPDYINGSLDYFAGPPNTAIQLNVADFNAANAKNQITNQKFALLTKNKNSKYLFQLRDFSNNGFSPEKTIFYLGLIYLSFVVLLVFFPGKKLERIEPIILMVIFALATLRFIMYWRLATFPPLENISKHELENTLINFDFKLGFTLPIPLTVIWILGLVLVLITFRLGKLKNLTLKTKTFVRNLYAKRSTINGQYLVFIGICLAIFLINKKMLHIEVLTRIISILVPIVGYVYFSGKANAQFDYVAKPLLFDGRKKWLEHLHAFVYYFVKNPTASITLLTFLFFAIADRGFAILFLLFVILKNVLINFLKKPLANTKISIGNRLFMPQNYWLYGLLALVVYLTLLSVKPLFYYLLAYKVWVLFAAFVTVAIVVWSLKANPKIQKWSIGLALVLGIVAIIPASNKWLDGQMADMVKHVQYRASIIYQPIHELLQDNEYTSFKTQKIIETAENQWLINSYISKEYDNSETINLRAHSKIGVDYSTQTRDIVLARYVISEWGNLTMYLILLLMVLPMVFYLVSYQITLINNNKEERDIDSYTGLIPLLILFTIALFVWLTSTNRFVFFGQDFPFLSLTSKLSVLMPLLLWAITLLQQPKAKHSFKVDVKNNSIKYIVFIGLIAIFALTTVKKNELSNDNFSIVMESTKDHIDRDLNGILTKIQDVLEVKRERITYNKLISKLAADSGFLELKNKLVTDNYTKSILSNLVNKPATAFQLSNPLFMVYDNGRYSAIYNKNLYLELPPIENRKIWQGNILESNENGDALTANLQIGKDSRTIQLPFFTHNPLGNYQLAVLPKSWINGAKQNKGILNIMNASKNKAEVFLYKNDRKNIIQNATSYASTLSSDDIATIYQQNKTFQIGVKDEGNVFATNKWVNGNYRIIYPLRADNFWIYSYANAIRNIYSNDSLVLANNYITLDYQLSSKTHKAIELSANQDVAVKNNNFNFSVIAADGDGHIRLMEDFVTNKRMIDPNDQNTIMALQRQQFFYSNAKNERDQWGNRNLLNLYLGPGSSIKPLTSAVVASQVNAGWENLQFSPPGGDRESFAGFKLIKPWKNDEHYFGAMKIVDFLAHSSNYYHALLMFLGSYSKDDFYNNETYSLQNVLTKTAGKNNNFPQVNFNGQNFFFKNFATKEWPQTDKSETHVSYFGNENSLIANGFEMNAGLKTKDKDKLDYKATTNDRVHFVTPELSNLLSINKNTGYFWSFPEESFFLQSERSHKEKFQNVSLGVMTTSLGGYPLRITPYKMAEMYLSMFTQNNHLQLSIEPQVSTKKPWNIDSTWGNGFNQFMAANIFTGMKQVITNGTGKRLQAISSKYTQYFFYAKTGTINEQQSGRKSSRRLIVTIADKDLTVADNIGEAKVYALYFVTDNTQDFDWRLMDGILEETIQSKSFKQYFNNNE